MSGTTTTPNEDRPVAASQTLEELQAELATARAAAAGAEERLRRFFSLSLDMLCTAGFNGHFTTLSPAWEAALGWSREELMSRPYLEFVHPADRQATTTEARLLERGGITVAFENRYRCKDGTYRHLLWSATSDLEHGHIYAVARDISALRGAEDELRQARALEETAAHVKNRFLTHMSHEFRTPLSAVLSSASVMLEEGSELSARQRSMLASIQSNGRDLLVLVNDLLDLANIESGLTPLARESVDLGELIASVVSRAAPQAEPKGLEMRTELADPLARTLTDPQRLKQVLANIIGNAVKFTDRGHVTVRVVAHPRTGLPQRIEVEDTGAGITYELQDRVYVAFHEGHDTLARRYAGTGIGLTISRSLCERLGFRLQLWSRLGVGTTFTIYLVPPEDEVLPMPGGAS